MNDPRLILDLYPLVILTKIDEVCHDTREDTSKAFHSQIIGDLVRLQTGLSLSMVSFRFKDSAMNLESSRT